jgi:hypothetical protein
MKLNNLSYLLAACISLCVSGCASVITSPLQPGSAAEGLVYHLPKKYIKLSYTLSAKVGEPATIKVEPTVAFPDSRFRLVARFNRNQLGKNEINIGVNESGLLTTGTATTTGQLGDVLKQAAAAAGTFSAFGAEPTNVAARKCDQPGIYETTLDPAESAQWLTFCGITLRLIDAKEPSLAKDGIVVGPLEAAGFYYRAPRVHRFKLSVNGRDDELISILLPDETTTHFLPIESALFATAKSDFVFRDGMATGYKVEAESELLGLLKLPAQVIAGYAGAVSDAITTQRAALNSSATLEFDALRAALCKTAISEKKLADAEKFCK